MKPKSTTNIIPLSRYQKPRAIKRISDIEALSARLFVELMQSAGYSRTEALAALQTIYDEKYDG